MTAFGHQILLLLLPDERFSWASRGIALAAAGRLADLRYEDPLLCDPFFWRQNFMFVLWNDWVEVCDSLASFDPLTTRVMAVL